MPINFTKEELLKNEESRASYVVQTLEEWTEIYESMNMRYIDTVAKYQSERRSMFKYIGTIAGGAAALSPQLFEYVSQPNLFYTGVGLLCLSLVVSVTYVISTVENDTTNLLSDLRKKNEFIKKARGPGESFLAKGDYSMDAFKIVMDGSKGNLATALKTDSEHELMLEKAKKGWYTSSDYTGEFLVLFTVIGFALLALGLTTFSFSVWNIILTSIGTFIIINIVSTFPQKVFTILGSPVDLIKSLSCLCKKAWSKD